MNNIAKIVYITLFLSKTAIAAHCQTTNYHSSIIESKDSIFEAKEFLRDGEKYYFTSPDSSLHYFKKAILYFGNNFENIENVGMCHQNISFIFFEKLNNLDSAVYYADLSVEKYQLSGNDLKKANMLKFEGMIWGLKSNLEEAKSHIYMAIEIFKNNEFDQGVAVCYFDLAISYEKNKNLDSTIAYITKANNIWYKSGNDDRIIQYNNYLLEKILDNDSFKEIALKIFLENESLIEKNPISDNNKKQFFTLALNYLEGKNCLADKSKKKYYEMLVNGNKK